MFRARIVPIWLLLASGLLVLAVTNSPQPTALSVGATDTTPAVLGLGSYAVIGLLWFVV